MHDTHLDGESRPLSELIPHGVCVAMVTTMIGRSHSSRPVTVAEVRDTRLSFLVNRTVDWAASIAGQEAIVHVTVADHQSSRYLALNGAAIVVVDEAEAGRLWTPFASVWFSGPNDPELAVLHFDVSDGQYWDGPAGRLGRAVALAGAAISGDVGSLGTHGQVLVGH
jgi:general stress protein 26